MDVESFLLGLESSLVIGGEKAMVVKLQVDFLSASLEPLLVLGTPLSHTSGWVP